MEAEAREARDQASLCRQGELETAERAARLTDDLAARIQRIEELESALESTSAEAARERQARLELAEWAARLEEDLSGRGDEVVSLRRALGAEKAARGELEARVRRLEEGEKLAGSRARHGRALIELRAEIVDVLSGLASPPS